MPSPAPSSPMKSATICTDGLPPAIAIRGGGGNDTNGGDGFNPHPHQLQGSPSGSGQQHHHHPHHPHGGLPAVVHSPNPSSNANDGTLTTAPFAPQGPRQDMNHRGFGSATTNSHDNAMSGPPGEAPTTAMLDACIRDLSRRRMAMAQQAAATSRAVAGMGGSNHSLPLPSRGGGGSNGLPQGMGSGLPSTGQRSSVAAAAMGLPPDPPGPAGSGKGGTVLADYAGKAADSFAQAFVDRWASAHSKDPAGGGVPVMGPGGMPTGSSLGGAGAQQPLQEGSYHSLPSGGSAKGTPRRGSSNGSGEKQWFVCDHCKTKAFVSRHELRQHEAKCEMRGMAMGPGMPGSMMGPGMMGPGMMAGSLHSLDRGASLGSSHHSMGQPPRPMPPAFMGMPPGMPHPGMALPTGMPPGMHPYMGMMYGDPSAASGMMMPPHMASGAFPGMPGSMPSVSEANAAANETSGRQRRKPAATVISPELIEASKGPFRTLPKPMALSLDDDKDWLTPLHCFVRRNCVEVFTATETDVQTPSKGKRKPIQVGQIGIRCPHCHKGRMDTDPNRERGSVYYPTSLGSIYNATMNLLQRHLHSCPRVPKEVMERYAELKRDDARSGTSKKYWIESARSLGFVDTLQGIKLSDKKAPRLGMDWDGKKEDGEKEEGKTEAKEGKAMAEDESEKKDGDEKEEAGENKEGDEKGGAKKEDGDGKDEGEEEKDGKEKKKEEPAEAPPLVIPADKSTATEFSFLLLSQMQPCVFTEADRLGKRKGLPTGFAGLACRHCFGCYGSGRFFPSSIKTLSDTSKTLNVLHNHMARCRKVPPETLEQLETARATHDDERAKMKFGSQKAFFAKIWSRLHDNRPDGMVIRPPQRQPSKSNPNGGMRRLSTSGSAGAAPPVHNPHMMRMMAGGMGMYPMMMGGGAGGAPMPGMPGMDPAQMQMMGYPMMGYPMMGPGGMPPGMGPGGMGGAPGGMPPQQGGQGDFKRPHESANEAMRKRMKHNADV